MVVLRLRSTEALSFGFPVGHERWLCRIPSLPTVISIIQPRDVECVRVPVYPRAVFPQDDVP